MGDSDSRVERIAPHYYSFRSTWTIPASRERAFDVLADLAQYPAWWPEFKSAQQTGDGEGVFSLRSVLPITLHFTLARDVEDRTRGQLRALAGGDIDGTVEWRIAETANGTEAHFAQDVILKHAAAAKIDWAIRPMLEWNHRAAMRSGAAGIQAYLARS